MAQLSRTDLKATWANASADYKTFFDNIADSMPNVIDDKIGGAVDGASSVKQYRATVVQSGTAAPSATVYVNTLGQSVGWSRLAAGKYTLTTSSAFTAGKTFVTVSFLDPAFDDVCIGCHQNEDMPGEIYVWHVNLSEDYADNVQFFISIDVYP
jgi:hypothetical protein